MRIRAAATIAAIAAVTTTAVAHDFWIQPKTFACDVNTPVKIELRVGAGYPGDIVSRLNSRIVRFDLVGPEETGEQPIPGQDGSQTAGVIRPAHHGLQILAYQSTIASIKLQPRNFETYLKDEGLDDIAAWRKEHGETDKEGAEIYLRCAKSLVQVGKALASQADRAVGLKLELVAHANPSLLKPGDDLAVQLLQNGMPIANRTVFARSAQHPEARASAHTDANGVAKLKISNSGMWIITSVLMAEASKDNDQGAQWESLWASLTFQVPDAK